METITTQRNIDAAPAKVHQALTTPEGLRGWWTTDCDTDGKQATFRFYKDGAGMEVAFRIDAAGPDRVEWTCTGEKNNPEWKDTRLSFRLSPTHSGTRLDLSHTGWREKSKTYEMCTGGWEHFMDSLKSWAQSGKGTPYGG